MAGHDDRDRIPADRRADGAARRRKAELARDLAVAARRAGLDAQQRLPDVALECRALQVERHVEGIDLAVEVGAQLARRRRQQRIVAALGRVDRVGMVFLLLEPGAGQAGLGAREQHRAERRVDPALRGAVDEDRVVAKVMA